MASLSKMCFLKLFFLVNSCVWEQRNANDELVKKENDVVTSTSLKGLEFLKTSHTHREKKEKRGGIIYDTMAAALEDSYLNVGGSCLLCL
jgi:hypothetical protein